jgi:hypothetical protein
MKNIDNIQSYNKYLLEKIVNEIFPCYDLWSLRSYQNRKFEHISGYCTETEKFSQFISTYAEEARPAELLLVFAIGQKNYPTIMLNTSKKYMIIKFDGQRELLGEPLIFPQYFRR